MYVQYHKLKSHKLLNDNSVSYALTMFIIKFLMCHNNIRISTIHTCFKQACNAHVLCCYPKAESQMYWFKQCTTKTIPNKGRSCICANRMCVSLFGSIHKFTVSAVMHLHRIPLDNYYQNQILL